MIKNIAIIALLYGVEAIKISSVPACNTDPTHGKNGCKLGTAAADLM
jgi:hypothetical protein